MSDQTTDKENGPADTLRDGAVKATIWKRESDKGAFYATTLSEPIPTPKAARRTPKVLRGQTS